jgi:hypothetical protein
MRARTIHGTAGRARVVGLGRGPTRKLEIQGYRILREAAGGDGFRAIDPMSSGKSARWTPMRRDKDASPTARQSAEGFRSTMSKIESKRPRLTIGT